MPRGDGLWVSRCSVSQLERSRGGRCGGGARGGWRCRRARPDRGTDDRGARTVEAGRAQAGGGGQLAKGSGGNHRRIRVGVTVNFPREPGLALPYLERSPPEPALARSDDLDSNWDNWTRFSAG